MVWPVRGKMHAPAGRSNRVTFNAGIYFDALNVRWWCVDDDLLEKPCTWEAALRSIAHLNNTGLNGQNDWRLPTIRELESLVDDSRHSPAFVYGLSLGTAPITGLWSSTTSTYEPRYAWLLYIKDGAIGVGLKAKADFHVLPVRG
jgi:hypothetical protein